LKFQLKILRNFKVNSLTFLSFSLFSLSLSLALPGFSAHAELLERARPRALRRCRCIAASPPGHATASQLPPRRCLSAPRHHPHSSAHAALTDFPLHRARHARRQPRPAERRGRCPRCPSRPTSLPVPIPFSSTLLAHKSRGKPLHACAQSRALPLPRHAARHWCAELELAPPPHSSLHRAPNHHHTALLKPHGPASSLLHRRGAAAAAQSRRRPSAPAEHPFPAPFLSNQPRSHIYLTAEKLTGPLLCPLRPPELA